MLLLLLPMLAGHAQAQASPPKPTEQQKIEQLIQAVEQLKEAEFIRSGVAYTAAQAASHLRMKRKRAGGKVKTAQDFIDGIAPTSYLSGKPYYITFKDGRQVTSREFFEGKLKDL